MRDAVDRGDGLLALWRAAPPRREPSAPTGQERTGQGSCELPSCGYDTPGLPHRSIVVAEFGSAGRGRTPRTIALHRRIIEEMLSSTRLGHSPYQRAKPAAPLLPAVQAALDSVEQHLASGARDVLLLGPPGVGKTLLLRRLAAQPLRPGRVFYCPFLHFEPQEATRWLLAMLRLPRDAGEERLVPELMRGGRPWAPNLLLLDEAQAIREDTLRHLAALFHSGDWGLSRVWAGIDGSALYRIPAVVDAEMPRVPLIYRCDESRSRVGLETITRELSRSSWRFRARKTLPIRGLAPRTEAPRESPPNLGEPPSRGLPEMRDVGSNPSALRSPAERVPELGRAPLRAPPPGSDPAASVPARRLGRPGRGVSSRRRAWMAASAAVFAGVITGLASVLSGTNEPTDAAALVAVAAAPVLVDINAVPWAHIVVDGREVGATPIGNLSLAPGSHRIQARFAQGELVERTVEVSDENRRVGFRGASVGRNGQR